MRKRAETIDHIDAESYDLCVIGGGASGAGCALDAQLRGLRTVLVDRGDFGCATSTASTKLIHGGLRYLQLAVKELSLAQYRVVRAALRERSLMIANARYLTRSRPLAVPCRNIVEAAYSRIGVGLYDLLSGGACLAASYFLDKRRTLQQMPWLNGADLIGTVVYSDGQFDDARYDLALIQTFLSAGGDALNYVAVNGFDRSPDGALQAAQVEDMETRARFRIRARAFINATGPFSDAVRAMAAPGTPKRLRQSKGVHILLPLHPEWNDHGLLIPATEDGRIIFAIPWMGRLLVGTTDTETDPSEEMLVSRGEAEFLLRHLNKYLARPFELGDIVTAMAGMRPLIKPANGVESDRIVRDYEIEVEPGSGLISLLGGKWTVYRAMAEDTIDIVESRLGADAGECRTATHNLFGSESEPATIRRELSAGYNVVPATIDHLIGKFGSRAANVLALTREQPHLSQPFVTGAPYILAEAVYCAREEMVVKLEDLLNRRLGIELFDWNTALQAAPLASQVLAAELGWSDRRAAEEEANYAARISRFRQEIGNGVLAHECA